MFSRDLVFDELILSIHTAFNSFRKSTKFWTSGSYQSSHSAYFSPSGSKEACKWLNSFSEFIHIHIIFITITIMHGEWVLLTGRYCYIFLRRYRPRHPPTHLQQRILMLSGQHSSTPAQRSQCICAETARNKRKKQKHSFRARICIWETALPWRQIVNLYAEGSNSAKSLKFIHKCKRVDSVQIQIPNSLVITY